MSHHNSSNTRPRWQNIALWVITGLLGAMFLFSGGAKVIGVQMHVENFAR